MVGCMTDTPASEDFTARPVHARHSTRRRVLRFGLSLAAVGVVVGSAVAPGVLAQTAQQDAQTIVVTNPTGATTPAVTTTDTNSAGTLTVGQTLPLTVSETEGPYFKANSPETTSLFQDGMQGTVLTITGQVLAQDGTPVANALLDFWQANASGSYDNSGYTLRGHQYTDANGDYTLTTVVPGLYPGRTEHIHVKVQAPNNSVLTTQLFFPGVAQNSRDSIFDPSLVLNIQNNADGSQSAVFNFVVPTA
jgi:protocatechuate 3,4-dioxygenase beta subunit